MTINNNNIFGAFTLNEARGSRLTGDWLNKQFVANYGWFGGSGDIPVGSDNTVDRIDFSNDTGTVSSRGPLSSARYYGAATGNSNYGWFGGGFTVTTVDRIDFSNDSSTASPRGPLSLARNGLAATGNSNYGWFGGGATPTLTATVDRINFSNDSATASVRGPLSQARTQLAATGNSNYGWFGSGYMGSGAVATVDRIDFSNDSSTASPRGPLSQARSQLAATGNSNYGWFGGGGFIPTPAYVSTVNRIDFSNDTLTASVRGPLSLARYNLAATGNSNYGWFGGGYMGSGAVATVDRIDFSNDSATASPRGPLSLARNGLAATSGVLNIRRQKAGNFGWFGGGGSPAPTGALSTVERIDFSSDLSTATPRSPLSSVRYRLAATGNSNYGWFGGGFNPSAPTTKSTVDRIDFSNDSATISIRGPLSLERRDLAATGNSNYGWFGGGFNPSAPTTKSTVDRIDFSNDSSTASVRGPLSPSPRTKFASTGNSNYGWFGGGDNPALPNPSVSIVDRIDFANDLSTASVRGPLSDGTSSSAAVANSNYGWFGGGQTTIKSAKIDRINFANDSVSASPRGVLSGARYALSATGNSNYGWFGGGYSSSSLSTVDRINFSNDLTTASVRGSSNPSVGKSTHAATSNTTR